MSKIFISDDYYDDITYTMLLNTLTDDDNDYINQHIENTGDTGNTDNTKTLKSLLYKRWTGIINSLPHNYYNQYYLQATSEDRNAWFKKYLDYPTKNILEMPEVL
jgi:hypothetical protein